MQIHVHSNHSCNLFCSLQNLHYTFVDPVPSSIETPSAVGDINKVVYSAVRPHDGSLGNSEDKCNDNTSATSAHVSRLWFFIGASSMLL